jgi:hypothetical protein
MNFTVYFSKDGLPDDTLSPVINIWEATAGGAQVATNEPMDLIAVGSGGYTFELLTADPNKNYFGLADSITLTERYAPCMTTVQGSVDFIKSIEGGAWSVENNQMIFYAEDNVTEVARFNLFAGATPSITNVTKREKV